MGSALTQISPLAAVSDFRVPRLLRSKMPVSGLGKDVVELRDTTRLVDFGCYGCLSSQNAFVRSQTMRRFLFILVGLCSSIPFAMAQEASPGGSPPVGVEALAEAVEKNATAISEQGKALAELREATDEIAELSKDLAKAVDKNAAAISDQNKAVSDLREAIEDLSGTNKQAISDLREAVTALTEQTRRASADLVQAISKLAEAHRSSSEQLREDVKWLRE